MTLVTSDTTRSILSGLELLREEHNLLLSSSTDEDKRQHVQQSLESIDLGIGEAFVMLQLDKHFENLDSETYKLILQVQRLTQENNWLRDELSLTEKHLQSSEQVRQDYECDIQLLNESLASSPTTPDNLNLSNSIDIDTEMPIETKERIQISSNPITKNHSEIPPRFRTLHNLVIQYAQAGRYEVAVPLCRQALEDLEKTHGHIHPDVATMLNILALVYRDQNKFQEALQLLTEALTIREKTLGYEHPAVAATLNNLAVLYGKKNRYKEAGNFYFLNENQIISFDLEPICKRALEIREKCFGIDHPDVAKQLNNLALLCLNQGKYDKVEEYYKRAIDIYSKHYGNTDPNVSKTKNNLASAYLRDGKYRLAAQLYQEVLSESQLTSNEQCQTSSIRDNTTILTALKNLGRIVFFFMKK
jgi:kinesin light chain